MAVVKPQTPEGQSPINGADTLQAPRPTSLKQIEANPKNALRSTWPTTQKGKQVSRLNAVKHGLRADEVIIRGLEDPADVKEIFMGLCEALEPEGYMELYLVKLIGSVLLRLRRVQCSELGEIRKQILSATQNDVEAEIEEAFDHFSERLPDMLGKSSVGITYQQEGKKELESEGIVSSETCNHLEKMLGIERGVPP